MMHSYFIPVVYINIIVLKLTQFCTFPGRVSRALAPNNHGLSTQPSHHLITLLIYPLNHVHIRDFTTKETPMLI